MVGVVAAIDKVLAKICLGAIYLYQKTLSPDRGLLSPWLRGRICTHVPHCSAYGKQCLERYGFFQGLPYTIDRIISCTPTTMHTYDPSHYTVVFFSGSPIGKPFMEQLAKDPRFSLAGVVTMPDVPKGRGMQFQENTVAGYAREIGLSSEHIAKPPSLKKTSKKYVDEVHAFYEWIEAIAPDMLVVVAYGKIIPQVLLDIPTIAPINVHGSLLPAYRGASPLQSVFLDQQDHTGITIMRMEAGLDEGPSIAQYTIPLDLDMTVIDLINILKKRGPKFLADSLRSYAKGELQAIAQDDSLASYTQKLEKKDALVDIYQDTLEDIYSKYRAYALWPKVYFLHEDKSTRVIIEEIVIDQDLYLQDKEEPLLTNSNDTLSLHPAIMRLQVKPAGKKSMSREDFVHGYCK